MSEQKRERQLGAIRRILVALDASTNSQAALEAAVKLAARLEAEVEGLFVEDVNLLRLAGLPFARELRHFSSAYRPLSAPGMEAELRVLAAQARQALAIVAEQMQVRWTFRVVRGQVAKEVLAAAAEADLLTMGRIGRPLTRRIRLGSTAREAVVRASRPVLLMQAGADLNRPVIVTYDGSPAAQRALVTVSYLSALAGATAEEPSPPTTIVLLLSTEDGTPSGREPAPSGARGPSARRLGEDEAALVEQLQEQAMGLLQERGVPAERITELQFRPLPQAKLSHLVKVVRDEEAGILVLGGENPVLTAEIPELLDQIDCPVLLVR